MPKISPALRMQLLLGFISVAMVVYLVLLGKIGVLLIRTGSPSSVGLGLAVLIMPGIGAWALYATLRDGFTHQRLSKLIADAGMELDVSDLPRRPSGRIERDAADALFETVEAEMQADPDNWQRWYRLGRAYEYAGDRTRARAALRRAADLQSGRGAGD